MRSGSTWVGTNWHEHQSQVVHFSHTFNKSKRTITVSWWINTESNDKSSPTYFLCSGAQKLTVNGTVVINRASTGTHNGSTAYRGFVDGGSWLDKHYGRGGCFWDTNGDYVGINRWVQCYGTKWDSGSFTKTANAAGSISFTIKGDFAWFGSTRRKFEKTFTITESSLIQTYDITYNKNDGDFTKGNSISDMPTSQTKTYNKDITISKTTPKSSDTYKNVNYKFVTWAKSKKSSFSGSDTVAPGSTYSTNADATLYAIWKKVEVPTYEIVYNKNDDDFLKGNSISDMPTAQTKTQNKDITLSKNVPKSSDSSNHTNYKFVTWAKSKSSSFSGSDKVSPGDTYSTNKDMTLYAIWEKVAKTIKYALNGGSTSLDTTVNTKYDTNITLPKASSISKYGYTLSGWENSSDKILSPGSSYLCVGDETLTAKYDANEYTISFVEKDGKTKLSKTISATYGSVLTGDFTYSVPGYKLIGWNTKQVIILNPDDSIPPITPNEAYNDSSKYTKDYMFIGGKKYTSSSPFYVKGTEARKYLIGQNITLYPILMYSTSMYVYTGSKWELAMPYVYDGTNWKQCLGYIYDNNVWKQ